MSTKTKTFSPPLRRTPSSGPSIHNRIGVALFKDGKIDQGIAHLKQALRLKPDFADAKNNLRIMLAKREKLKTQTTTNPDSTTK
jgi:Flp pilus assembly protein TadD